MWFFSRILVLLGHQKCAALHNRTIETIHEILQAVSSRDAFLYGRFLKELVLCLTGKQTVIVCLYYNTHFWLFFYAPTLKRGALDLLLSVNLSVHLSESFYFCDNCRNVGGIPYPMDIFLVVLKKCFSFSGALCDQVF